MRVPLQLSFATTLAQARGSACSHVRAKGQTSRRLDLTPPIPNPKGICPEYPGSHVAQRFQGFRFGSSPVVYIGARLDTRAGQYILLWRDIQQALPGVEQVRCGATVAPFVADDDFTLIYPLRIKYLPGVILNVILEDTGSAPPGYAPPGYTLLDTLPLHMLLVFHLSMSL